MVIKISRDQPVYLQIKAYIRDGVISGLYTPGDRIPTVRELAAQTNINPNTIQRAMAELEQEQLLISHGTLGRFVTDNPAVIAAIKDDAVQDAVRECLMRFHALGLSTQEAAALLTKQKEE